MSGVGQSSESDDIKEQGDQLTDTIGVLSNELSLYVLPKYEVPRGKSISELTIRLKEDLRDPLTTNFNGMSHNDPLPVVQRNLGASNTSISSKSIKLQPPGLSDRNSQLKREPSLNTTNVHGVYPIIANSQSSKRLSSISSSHAMVDNESIYSEIASSFSNNFLFNFVRRENPLKSGGLGKEYWIDDSSATKCFLCEKNFTTFRRKHHCRVCGQIFCSNCTLFISGEKFNFNGKMRVCKSCLSYADKYDDMASSDESVLEENSNKNIGAGESLYPSKSIDTVSTEVQPSLRTGSFLDQEVLTHAPTPPPQMAIPTTRYGASVEIPSRTLHRSNSQRPRKSRFSQSSYSIRAGALGKNVHSAIDDGAPNTEHNSTTQQPSNLRFFQQLTPNHFASTSNLFSFGLQSQTESSSPHLQDLKAVRTGSPSHKSPQPSYIPSPISHSDDESEDEKSMSLYEALHDTYGETDTEHGKFSRMNSSDVMVNSNERQTRMSTQARSERAQASLWRMKNRRRNKTNFKLASNSQQNQQYIGTFHKSKAPNLQKETFDKLINNNKNNMFDFTGGYEGASSSVLITKPDNNLPLDHKRILSLPNKDLKVLMETHASNLLKQALADEGLENSEEWENTLLRVLRNISKITPDIRGGDSFDIRQYLKLKRVPGAHIKDTVFVNGVVFSKNVALKSMAKELINPQICLVMFPIEYTKTAQQFMSLDLVVAQEKESLHKLVNRIIALNPDILFVGASISGLALEMLDQAGIVVVPNMKPQVMERISKLTNADVVTSIDKLAVNPLLGTCSSFQVKQYVYQGFKRSYIFLTGCNETLGGTLLLRGSNQLVLKKIKNILEFIIYVFFNLDLEYSLFRDEYLTINDNVENSSFNQDNFSSMYQIDFVEKLKSRSLSSSSAIKFYPPPLLYKAREADDALNRAIQTLTRLKSVEGTGEDLDEEKRSGSIISLLHDDPNWKQLVKSLGVETINIYDPHDFKIIEYVLEKKIDALRLNLQNWQRQWELFYSHSPYLLEPTSHQSLLFLYSMVNSKTTTPCVGPEILGIDYYWMSDISLGQYIEHISLTANGECPEGCGHNLLDHYRSYVHGNAKVDVIVELFQSRIPGLQNVILMWSYCKECRQSTPVIPMNENTWKYSFGKYLELSFWSSNVRLIGPCPHDFKKHIRYFGIYNLAVRMEYSKVETLELVVPKFKLHWKPDIDIKLKFESFKTVKTKSKALFDSIWERLNRVKVDSMTIDKMEAGQKRIEELKEKADREKEHILNFTNEIYESTGVTEHLPLNAVVRNIQELSVEWDIEFQEFETNFMPSEKDISRITSSQLKKLFMDKDTDADNREQKPEKLSKDELSQIEESLHEKHNTATTESKSPSDESQLTENLKNIKTISGRNVSEKISKMEAMLGMDEAGSPEKIDGKMKFLSSTRSISDPQQSSQKSISTPGTGAGIERLGTNQLEQELRRDNSAAQRINSNGKVKQLTTLFDQLHFDQISLEFELQREKERRKLIASRYRAIPVIASKPIVEVYKNVHDAVEEELSDDETNDKTTKRRNYDEDNDDKQFDEKKDAFKGDEKDIKKLTGIPPTERASLMKTLTSFWADRSAALWKPLAYPLGSTEHIFVDSDVIVREDEPSSLIAFCLSSSDYVSKLKTMRENVPISTVSADNTSVIKTNQVSNDNATISDSQFDNSTELERIMLKKTAIHLKYQFQEGASLLSCKIFFAEQFDAFRQECGIEGNFVQSLSRCIKWDSTGGKSGSSFLKTLDDRFIIKELSHAELDAFVKFAPSYFEYLAQALFHDLPTVLAKIYGFYQIHIRNPIDNKNIKLDLLIMENLFYDRKTSRIFDLKGSMRNRHVEQTGKENEVLLDENMVEYIYESPLFVKEYAKKLLRTSLWNDTLFLSRMNVMDYSLVIGIDSENHELVVGIIDCIRTFTWDKKLESWVKEKGLVGGGGKEPTVVTPRQYKNRFRDAMDRYILMVPDCWNQGPIE